MKNDFKSQMQDNMQEIEQTEAVIDNERNALKVHIDEIEEEDKRLQDELRTLEKQLRAKDVEIRTV